MLYYIFYADIPPTPVLKSVKWRTLVFLDYLKVPETPSCFFHVYFHVFAQKSYFHNVFNHSSVISGYKCRNRTLRTSEMDYEWCELNVRKKQLITNFTGRWLEIRTVLWLNKFKCIFKTIFAWFRNNRFSYKCVFFLIIILFKHGV